VSAKRLNRKMRESDVRSSMFNRKSLEHIIPAHNFLVAHRKYNVLLLRDGKSTQ
jgi:hypothetical protein